MGLPVGEELPFFLEPTRPPSWSELTSEDWRREHGTVLRLSFECSRDDTEPWTVTGEIDTQTDSAVEIPTAGR